MNSKELKADVYWVGAVDWDRRLFDVLIPLPDGTSYNAYLVRGSEKTALIDTVDPSMSNVLMNNLNQLNVEKIDFVVVNHAEQDHSGTLPQILRKYPKSEVIATSKCRDLLTEMLLIPEEKIVTVDDRATLSLGNKTLEFVHAPWVHWPETMVTYLREDRILFSCDLFGSHLAASNLYVADEATVYEAAKRYYAEIMMPFKAVIQRNLEKIDGFLIDVIATSHGPIYNKPKFILDAYRKWIEAPPRNLVVLPYVSMHGSTQKMVEHFVAALVDRGIAVKQFNLANSDIGKLAMELVDAATIVVGSPTVLGGPHPNVIYAVYLVNALRPKLEFASIIGSYGWGGRTAEQITKMLSNLRVTLLEPVVTKGFPKQDDFKELDRLADEIFRRHKERNLK